MTGVASRYWNPVAYVGDDLDECETCDGTGVVSSGDLNDDFDWRTDVDADIPCPGCGGTGRTA